MVGYIIACLGFRFCWTLGKEVKETNSKCSHQPCTSFMMYQNNYMIYSLNFMMVTPPYSPSMIQRAIY
ncbi:hypothetical protein I3843_16G095900 [Carya illinoinensis]|nr:hypothetical protein I3843_16G095900 [Carya illinoinensis]